jgi:hypothetical protein
MEPVDWALWGLVYVSRSPADGNVVAIGTRARNGKQEY